MISTALLLSKTILASPSLTATFHRIHTLGVINPKDYFPVQSARQLAQRFPSLSRVKLRVYSFDSCVTIVDILLGSLAKLAFVKVHFERDTLLDDPFTRRYVVEKRRRAFTLDRNHEHRVSVRNDGQSLIIRLE